MKDPREPSEEELLKKLQEALGRDGEEVSLRETTGRGNAKFISIQRKPSGEPQWSYGANGEFVVDWKEKFSRQEKGQSPPFNPGELVSVSGFVGPDPNGLYSIHVDADGRIADNFFIANVPEPDPLKSQIGMPLEAIVKVGEERKADFRLSNVWNYDAELMEVVSRPFVNPTPKEIEEAKGKRVVIEGTFLEYTQSPSDRFLTSLGFPKDSRITGGATSGHSGDLTIKTPDGKTIKRHFDVLPDDYYEKDTRGLIQTMDGKIYSINMSTGKTVFSGGVLENLGNKIMLKGDKVRIAAGVSKSGKLHTAWCDPCYLDEPCPGRQLEYVGLRKKVEYNTDQIKSSISSGNYQEARKMIGETRAFELTKNEVGLIKEITNSMPDEEKPIQMPEKRDFWTKSIDEAYQVRLESMTKGEFVKFARSAVTGERKQTGDHADTSYLFGLSKDFGIPDDVREGLMVDCIENRLGRIRGKPYVHKRDFDDKYNVDQALSYLAGIGTESAAEKIFGYLKSFVEQVDFKEIGWREKDRNELPEDFLFAAVNALSMHSDKISEKIWQKELPYLKKMVGYLAEHADEPVTLDVLERTINHVETKLDK